MKKTTWPLCFNYDHASPFPTGDKHTCNNCRNLKFDAGIRANPMSDPAGDWCMHYRFTDKPKCTKKCKAEGWNKHVVGCDIERWARFNYESGRYDDHPNYQRAEYNKAILIIPSKKVLAQVSKDHAEDRSCRYGCVPARAKRCKKCNLKCLERKAEYDGASKVPVELAKSNPDGTRKVPLLNHPRRRPGWFNRRLKVLRRGILKPAVKVPVKLVFVQGPECRDICKGCADESEGFYKGSLCHDCQVIIHTRPTNYRKSKKSGGKV